MEYLKLFAGIILFSSLAWIFLKIRKRKGFLNALFEIDTMIGMAAGVYLIVSALQGIIL
jgi:hypothetical protein